MDGSLTFTEIVNAIDALGTLGILVFLLYLFYTGRVLSRRVYRELITQRDERLVEDIVDEIEGVR